MAFLIAFTHAITNSNGTSNLTIYGYAPNTNNIKTNPLGLAVSLIALNTIYSTISLSISEILTAII